MNNTGNEKLHKWFGEQTPAKASGLAFSLASLLPSLLAIVILLLIGALGAASDPDYAQKDWYLYLNFLLPQVGFLLVTVIFLRYKQMPIRTALRRQKCEGKYFILALLVQILLLGLSELNVLFLQFLERFGYQDSGIQLPSMNGFGFVGVLITVAVLPALVEELFFRGVLLSGLHSFGKWGAVLVCGAMFSLYHQNPAQTLYQFCCGVAYAAIALRAGSILPTALAHFCNNALILILTACGVTAFPNYVFIIEMVLAALALVALMIWLIVFDKKEAKEPQDRLWNKNERRLFFGCASVGILVCGVTWFTVLFTGM